MKRKIFTLLMSSLFVSATFAQWVQPEVGMIEKAGAVIPVIDGVNTNDGEYLNANVYPIDREFFGDLPRQASLPEVGNSQTNWRAVYSEEGDKAGMYILITVVDDAYLPHYISGGANSWQFDHLELYFDTNYEKVDDMGGHSDNIATGHAQIAPDYTAAKEDGTVSTYGGATGIQGTWAFKLDAPNVTAEYFVPFKQMKTNEGTLVDLFGTIGFDVTVIDRDDAVVDTDRKRMVWSNDGQGLAGDGVGGNESWNDMDDAGLIQMVDPNQVVFVESIAIDGGSITENNGSLQLTATVLPADASNKELKWTLENVTGSASLSATGVLTAKTDGTVKVMASATDGSYVDSEVIEITISNQIVTIEDLNYVKNGNFVVDGANPANWNGGAIVVDGVAECDPPAAGANPWDWTFTQKVAVPLELKDLNYIFKFKAWADEERTFNVDFEDSANGYRRYGASTDPEAASSGGRSDWTFTCTTEPTMYEFHLTFDELLANTNQSMQFMLGLADAKVYLDSVSLVAEPDLALLTPDYVPVASVALAAAGMQMSAEVLPANATLGGVKWSIIPGTGAGTIDANGMVTATASGTVTVVATAKDDSGVVAQFELLLTGIAKNKVNPLKVYPSVTSDVINIEGASSNAVATIYNSQGRKVAQVVAGKNIPVSNLAKGVYVVKVNDNVTRFIKK